MSREIQSTSAAAGSSALPLSPPLHMAIGTRLPTAYHRFAVHAGHENFASSFKAQKQDENPRCWMAVSHGGEKRNANVNLSHPPARSSAAACAQSANWCSSCTTRPLRRLATTSGFCAPVKECRPFPRSAGNRTIRSSSQRCPVGCTRRLLHRRCGAARWPWHLSVLPHSVEGIAKVCKKPLHYKGVKFHRICKNFVIEGGDIDKGSRLSPACFGRIKHISRFTALRGRLCFHAGSRLSCPAVASCGVVRRQPLQHILAQATAAAASLFTAGCSRTKTWSMCGLLCCPLSSGARRCLSVPFH